jgi:LPXTG-motif cell wall-anchored protein
VYYIRETETLEGFSVSGEVIKFVLDENYVIPETMPKMINYTIIQTGVRIAVTGVMILGAVFVVVSGILFIVRKKKNAKAQED